MCLILHRWVTDDASIFSVNDGKRLAQTPVKSATFYEQARAMKIARAQLETPTVGGLRWGMQLFLSQSRSCIVGSVCA